jgi:hypothetical protein
MSNISSFTHTAFWAPPAYWLPSYRCGLCKDIMSKRDPVVLRCCNHSFCAECISIHVLRHGNIDCPTCHRSIDSSPCPPLPSSKPRYIPYTPRKYRSSSSSASSTLSSCSSCSFTSCSCGYSGCPGECGVLICGCIDTCRCSKYR